MHPAPVDQLLSLGEAAARAPEWPDYRSLGILDEHVPLVIRMMTDRRLRDADAPEVWAPLHAWRALAQLRAVEAVRPLASLFHEMEEWDWVNEELPTVFAMIGPAAIPVLVHYLDQRVRGLYPRAGASSALCAIAKAHPDRHHEIVVALTDQLRRFTTQDRTLNGFLVGDLIDLAARDAAPVMEQAFAAGRVDQTIAGDWEDVQVALGLLAQRRTPAPNYFAMEDRVLTPPAPPSPKPATERRRTDKRRRKQAAASKRRNRRK